jgi:hypothetical protein
VYVALIPQVDRSPVAHGSVPIGVQVASQIFEVAALSLPISWILIVGISDDLQMFAQNVHYSQHLHRGYNLRLIYKQNNTQISFFLFMQNNVQGRFGNPQQMAINIIFTTFYELIK